MSTYLLNDRFVKDDEISISIEDRGYYFGDGVYEVIRVYGGTLFTAEEHIARLYESAAKIRMQLPYGEEEMKHKIEQLVRDNGIDEGHVYVQATRGAAPRVHQFPGEDIVPVITGYTKAYPATASQHEPVTLKSVEDIRWMRCDIKSLNLLANVMAKQEAYEEGHYEALLHRSGTVTEGSSSNMFGVKDGVIHTHPVSNFILNGITRRVVMECCTELDQPVIEEPMALEDVYNMDEFFMTSTTNGIVPVSAIDGKQIGDGRPGPVTEALMAAFDRKLPVPVESK
ncbi:D-amino-acid transaminase [Edaphobacillus lindanitolerans]|uniref:D-alanine aminotransferase n=1 Tax=Edaphobacillus lindanitolerans TaxID=550447 RepID=A0A1U7PR37_9BACI|nr:D-amino-acid transaminase [Edaphobacillus lindanitolerans]SIT85498.1 D-alanine transaminase [Edaphobacillus lindanitolerans]